MLVFLKQRLEYKMKIVINECYGGFGLSNEAILRLLDLGSDYVKTIEPRDYYGKDWEKRFQNDLDGKRSWGPIIKDGKIVLDEYRDQDARNCPFLIQVVEEMGEASFGNFAKLKIIEVPDDLDLEIDNYDGVEHIAEAHRTWS